MDIIFVKVGKAIDWFENDSTTDDGKQYMQSVVEPFLDLSVTSKADTKIAKTKLAFNDNRGKKYTATIKDLVNGGVKVYYDEETRPNLTPFIADRAEGMAQSLFDVVADYMFDRQQASNKQLTGE